MNKSNKRRWLNWIVLCSKPAANARLTGMCAMKYSLLLVLFSFGGHSFAGEDGDKTLASTVISYVKMSQEYENPISSWPTETNDTIPKYSMILESAIDTLQGFRELISKRPPELKARQHVLQCIELDNWFLCEIKDTLYASYFDKGSWVVAYLVEKNTNKLYYYWSW